MHYDVTAFGTVGDGKALDTAAIQAAIDACHQSGGGRVVIPAGTYKTGTLWMKSHVELHLEMGAVLLASDDLNDYNAEDAYPQNFFSKVEEWCGKHLLIALGCEDVALTGLGKINGNGHLFYDPPVKKWNFIWVDGLALSRDKENLRPGQLLCFIECKRVRVQDIHIENTTCWNCYFHGCEYVQVRGIRIQNPSTFANTDGIDIDTCRYVTVSDCIIDTADDAFAIRCSTYRLRNGMSACEHITITNCVLGSSSGAFRIGVGDGPIRHVRVSNITVKRAATGFILTSNYSQSLGRYTPISDISFQNITLTNTQRTCKFGAAERGVVKNISFTNISCEVFGGSYMKSPEGKHIQNVLFENFSIRVREKEHIDPALPDERRPHVLWMENTVGCVFRHFEIHGTENASQPWEAAVMAENCEITAQDCNFIPQRKDTV